MKTKAEKLASPAEPTIPHPPTGGSWTWDAAKLEWVVNTPDVKPAEQVQE